MGIGRRFELSLYNDIEENTSDKVHAAVSDYSGGASASFCDLEVYYPPPLTQPHTLHAAFVEVKKTSGKSGNRGTVLSGSSNDESGRGELERLINSCPPWGRPFLALKWDNRELIVERADHLLEAMLDDERDAPWDARLTPSENVSMRKPTLQNWDSQASGKEPWKALLDGIGVESKYYDHSDVSEFDPEKLEA